MVQLPLKFVLPQLPTLFDIVPKKKSTVRDYSYKHAINGSVDSAAVSNESGQVTQTTTSSVSSTSGY